MSIMAVGSLLAISLAFLLLVPTAHATAASITQTGGNAGVGVQKLSVSLSSVSQGDAIVVFEYFEVTLSSCGLIQTPTDSQSNNWVSLGCVVDGGQGVQSAFYVRSASISGVDTVSCNWLPSSGTVEACYVFDVANPAGNPSVVDTGTGTGGVTAQVPVLASAPDNSILLATVGYTGFCHSPTVIGQVPEGLSPFVYNPPSECALSFGLSGSWVSTQTTGTFQWVMDPHVPSGGGGQISPAWNLMVVEVPGVPSITTSTSYATTITGWLAPDSAHFSSSLALMTFPLMGMVFAMTFVKIFGGRGDIGVTFSLAGLTIGTIMADLPSGTVTSTTFLIPFAYILVAALLTFLYWWNS
jgi:hypothetical protein